MRRALLLGLLGLCGTMIGPATALATVISLTTAVVGSNNEGDVIDLTVSFDANGSPATNLVGQELYVKFSGLTPVAGSYTVGSFFTPFSADVLAFDGACIDVGCGYPLDDAFSPDYYGSFINVFAPSTPSGAGTLFTMQFTVAPGSGHWSLNLFGDDQSGLLWDPPPQDCDPNDLLCDPDPSFATIPYAIVLPADMVPDGMARVNVGVTAPAAPPDTPTVPESGSLILVGSGLLAVVARARARRPTSCL